MTEWFNRKPGDFVSESTSDPTLVLVGDGVPDWVRVPPEIRSRFGDKLKVVRAFGAPCPMCKNDTAVRHLELDRGLFVAECTHHGFAFYQPR